MGMIIYKINLGTSITGPEGKQRMVIAIARLCEIFYSTSRKSINMWAEQPMEITYREKVQAPVGLTTKDFTESLIKDLIDAYEFNILVNVAPVQLKIIYNRDMHMDNACEIHLRGYFKDMISTASMLGFVNMVYYQQAKWSYNRAEDRVERLNRLIQTVFKRHLGDSYFYGLNKVSIQEYLRDAIYFNIFGWKFTIRRKV